MPSSVLRKSHSLREATEAEEHTSSSQREPATIRTNAAWAFIGNAFYSASQWGILVLFARLATMEDVGRFSLALAISAPVAMFFNLKLRAVLATDARGDFDFSDYLSLRIVTVLVAVSATAAIGFFRYDNTTAWIIGGVALGKAFESISDVCHGLMQKHERQSLIAFSQIGKGLGSLLAVAAGLLASGKAIWGASSLALMWGVLSFVDLKALSLMRGINKETLSPQWKGGRLYALSKLTLPLGLVTAMNSLRVSTPRLFIEGSFGLSELGAFSTIAYLLVAGNTVINAIGQSSSPRLAAAYFRGDIPAFRRMIFQMVSSGIILGVLSLLFVLFFGSELLTLVYGSGYTKYSDIFSWVALAGAIGFGHIFLGTGLSAMRRYNIQLPIHFACLLIVALASYFMVPQFGLKGAAWAMCFGALGEGLFYLAAMRRALFSRAGVRKVVQAQSAIE